MQSSKDLNLCAPSIAEQAHREPNHLQYVEKKLPQYFRVIQQGTYSMGLIIQMANEYFNTYKGVWVSVSFILALLGLNRYLKRTDYFHTFFKAFCKENQTLREVGSIQHPSLSYYSLFSSSCFWLTLHPEDNKSMHFYVHIF